MPRLQSSLRKLGWTNRMRSRLIFSCQDHWPHVPE
jgi:hypothetical protein